MQQNSATFFSPNSSRCRSSVQVIFMTSGSRNADSRTPTLTRMLLAVLPAAIL